MTGSEAGIELVHGRDIAKAADPAAARDEIKKRIEAESSPYAAAGMALTDDVITPAETRAHILEAFTAVAAARIMSGSTGSTLDECLSF